MQDRRVTDVDLDRRPTDRAAVLACAIRNPGPARRGIDFGGGEGHF